MKAVRIVYTNEAGEEIELIVREPRGGAGLRAVSRAMPALIMLARLGESTTQAASGVMVPFPQIPDEAWEALADLAAVLIDRPREFVDQLPVSVIWAILGAYGEVSGVELPKATSSASDDGQKERAPLPTGSLPS